MIDEKWFEDWEYYALWKYGFSSFADFALFRSALSNGDDWRRYIDGYDNDTPAEDDLSPVVSPSGNRSTIDKPQQDEMPLWLSRQDWYDASEWHDQLGW